METFFRDKKKIFECKVYVEGADIEKTSARLLLKFPKSNLNLLYYGKINENNICSIEIPALKEVKDNEGEAILEVISESTYFEPWKSNIELKQAKTVKVEMLNREGNKLNENITKVTVSPIKKQTKNLVKEVIKPKVDFKSKLLEIFRKSIKEKLITSSGASKHLPSKTSLIITEKYKGSIKNTEETLFQYFIDKLGKEKISLVKKNLL